MIKIYKKSFDDCIEWRRKDNNLLHRENGPAIEWIAGRKDWYINGKFHRLDGPAIEHTDGHHFWYQNGKLHRTDGPAVECLDGRKSYWLNGKIYPGINSNEEWIIFQIIN